jgi:hypothetical protein
MLAQFSVQTLRCLCGRLVLGHLLTVPGSHNTRPPALYTGQPSSGRAKLPPDVTPALPILLPPDVTPALPILLSKFAIVNSSYAHRTRMRRLRRNHAAVPPLVYTVVAKFDSLTTLRDGLLHSLLIQGRVPCYQLPCHTSLQTAAMFKPVAALILIQPSKRDGSHSASNSPDLITISIGSLFTESWRRLTVLPYRLPHSCITSVYVLLCR